MEQSTREHFKLSCRKTHSLFPHTYLGPVPSRPSVGEKGVPSPGRIPCESNETKISQGQHRLGETIFYRPQLAPIC